MPGYMVPLEDRAGEVSEFLLVPYVGACVHTPPPPPNQLVCVRMESGQRVPVSLWNPVWIHGTLTVERTTNLYGSVCPSRWLAHRYRPASGDQSLRYRRNVKSWLRRVDGGRPAISAHGNPSRPNGMKRRSCSPA